MPLFIFRRECVINVQVRQACSELAYKKKASLFGKKGLKSEPIAPVMPPAGRLSLNGV